MAVTNTKAAFESLQALKTAQRASKSKGMAIALGILLTPAAYAYMGEWGWCFLNFITFNYCLLGFIIVPFHVTSMISKAQEQILIDSD